MLSHFSRNSTVPAAPDAAAGANGAARHAAATLSIGALERLAPRGHLKAAYPHIWERIWLFCGDPAHLDKYLASLSIQQRSGRRDGLRPEAMTEIADIQAANQRYLAAASDAAVWDAAALKR
jgi:hypothetical protein